MTRQPFTTESQLREYLLCRVFEAAILGGALDCAAYCLEQLMELRRQAAA